MLLAPSLRLVALPALLVAAALEGAPAAAQGPSAGDLAQALANPIASLIQVPIQQNFDFGFGPGGEGWKSTTNIQPVVPVSLNRDWNLISRTILPIVHQKGLTAPGQSQFGLGDTVQSLFFSPKAASGLVWGAGPVFLLPTATGAALGSEKWGIGPTAVVLKQQGPWTVGALANHIWSLAGADDRADVSVTFLQPFAAYATKSGTTYGINMEITRDWTGDVWVAPLNLVVSQLLKAGNQPIQIGAGARYYVASPAGGPGWGVRINLVLLFPR